MLGQRARGPWESFSLWTMRVHPKRIGRWRMRGQKLRWHHGRGIVRATEGRMGCTREEGAGVAWVGCGTTREGTKAFWTIRMVTVRVLTYCMSRLNWSIVIGIDWCDGEASPIEGWAKSLPQRSTWPGAAASMRREDAFLGGIIE